jgi:3-oxoacyl-[acyl-carrier-protein] synthase III
MRTANLHLQALGVFLPEARLSLAQARRQGLCGPEVRGQDIVSVPVAGETPSVDLAVEASRRALARLGDDDRDIDLLLHAVPLASGPPGWSQCGYILRELGCARAAGFDVYQACNGFLASLELAAGWLATHPHDRRVLLATGSNAADPRMDRWHSAGPGVVLGDGGAAAVLGRTPGLARVDAIASTTFPEIEGVHRGSTPVNADSHVYHTTDVMARAAEFCELSGLTSLDLQGRMAQGYQEVTGRVLDEAGIVPADLARVVFPHMSRDLMTLFIMMPLGLKPELGNAEFARRVGHLGAGDFVASLDHLLAAGELFPGDRVLLAGGTGGFSAACAVLTIGDRI